MTHFFLKFIKNSIIGLTIVSTIFTIGAIANINQKRANAQSLLTINCTQKLKIMPLGDSITEGIGQMQSHFDKSFRFPLYNKLVANGYSPDFVGTKNGFWNNQANPFTGFDADNEAYGGTTNVNIKAKIVANNAVSNYKPDFILLMGGTTNDVFAGNSASQSLANFTSLYNEARSQSPRSTILVSTIPQLPNHPQFATIINTYNSNLIAYFNSIKSTTELVEVVDHGLFNNSPDFVDGIHPSDIGHSKLADNFYSKIISSPLGQRWTSTCMPVIRPPAPFLTESSVSATNSTRTTKDFNSDGKSDILWRNKVTGQNIIWFMNGATRLSYVFIDPVVDLNWRIKSK